MIPLIPFIFLIRIINNKEDINRIRERIGLATNKRPRGKLIWINAVSVGEVRSILPLTKELSKMNINILITSVTVTSAKHIKGFIKNDKKIFHQFAPIDNPFIVKKFLKYWRPDISIFVESEIWPNMITKSFNMNIPLILIQARISEKTYQKWLYFRSLSKYLLKKFDLIITQDLESGEKFLNLGAINIIENINLKLLSKAPRSNYKKEQELLKLTRTRLVLLFASIHDEIEENASIISHRLGSKLDKNLLTIIVPRHPEKIDNLIKIIEKNNLNYKIRSKGELPSIDTDIYIANTIGEMGSFFSICDISFIGGTLSNKGGHNLIEPALEKCSIIFGPDVANHKSVSKILIKSKGAIQIKNTEELGENICELIRDKEYRNNLGELAYQAMNNMSNPTFEILKNINPIINSIKDH